jgi:5-methylcytosine-specific restriction endonuclease McrA
MFWIESSWALIPIFNQPTAGQGDRTEQRVGTSSRRRPVRGCAEKCISSKLLEVRMPNGVSGRRLLRAFDRTNGRCAYCGAELLLGSDWVVDHIIARARGGSNDDSNLVASCARCNGRKKTKTPEEFRHWLQTRIIEDLGRALEIINLYTPAMIGIARKDTSKAIKDLQLQIATMRFGFAHEGLLAAAVAVWPSAERELKTAHRP